MSNNPNIKNFFTGIRLVPVSSSGIIAEGEMEIFSNTLRIYIGGTIQTFSTDAGVETLTNKTIDGNNNTLLNIAYSSLILTGHIVNADINASAAIAFSKLASLTSGNLLVGSAGNVPTSVAMSGEASISNTGAVTLLNSAVIGKVLTGYVSSPGTVAATDSILQAFQKLSGNAGNFVTGPGSSTDNAVTRFDGTTGKLVQNSLVTIDDSGTITFVGAVASDNISQTTTGTQEGLSQSVTSSTGATTYGIRSFTTNSASGTNGSIQGIASYVTKKSANNADASAFVAQVEHNSTGTTHTGYGFRAVAPTQTSSGTFANYYGLYAEPAPGGLVTGNSYTLNITGGTSFFGGSILANTLTASQAVYTDAGKNLVSQTGTQVTATLDVFSSSLKGLVPASGGGTVNFLRADGTWAASSSPLTTKGDLFTFSTVNARLPVGTNGQILTADSTQTTGIKWAAAPATGANTSLSNLASTAVNVALTSSGAQDLGTISSPWGTLYISDTQTGTLESSTSITASYSTASRALVTDGSKNIVASSVTSTELGYVSGVTSAIQTQFTGKANTALSNLASTAVNVDILPGVNNTRFLGSAAKTWGGGYIQVLIDPTDNAVINTTNRTLLDTSAVVSLDFSGTSVISASKILDMGAHRITSVTDPTLAQDAATKNYVDSNSGGYTTSIKTTTYTAVNRNEIFANSSGGAFTITLPASPSIGNRVKIIDYSGNWATNNITVGRNSQNINGSAADFTLNINNSWAEFIFADATQGWRVIS